MRAAETTEPDDDAAELSSVLARLFAGPTPRPCAAARAKSRLEERGRLRRAEETQHRLRVDFGTRCRRARGS